MGTFSKSLASCGGFLAGPSDVIEYLRIQSARLPVHRVGACPPPSARRWRRCGSCARADGPAADGRACSTTRATGATGSSSAASRSIAPRRRGHPDRARPRRGRLEGRAAVARALRRRRVREHRDAPRRAAGRRAAAHERDGDARPRRRSTARSTRSRRSRPRSRPSTAPSRRPPPTSGSGRLPRRRGRQTACVGRRDKIRALCESWAGSALPHRRGSRTFLNRRSGASGGVGAPERSSRQLHAVAARRGEPSARPGQPAYARTHFEESGPLEGGASGGIYERRSEDVPWAAAHAGPRARERRAACPCRAQAPRGRG